ncbi:MAG: hypothetical protein N4J56_006559 [Chroococcidiopsis sp. SAG 2025]|nr:hypothetical protein [Chroococcidiopsis sp. SAG 2025]
MVAGTVPKDGKALLGILCLQVLQKLNREFRIALGVGFDQELLGAVIQGSKVGLSLALVDHWNFNALCRFTPDIPCHVPPQQMTLIQKQHYQFAGFNLCSMCLQPSSNLLFFSLPIRSLAWGYASAFFSN